VLLSFHQSVEKWLVNAGRLSENVNPSEQPRGWERGGPSAGREEKGRTGCRAAALDLLSPAPWMRQRPEPGAPPAPSPALSSSLQFWAITAGLSPPHTGEGAAAPWEEATQGLRGAKPHWGLTLREHPQSCTLSAPAQVILS